MFLVLLLQFLFAVAFIFFKKTIPYGPPFFLVAIRMIISGSILLLFYIIYSVTKSNRLVRRNSNLREFNVGKSEDGKIKQLLKHWKLILLTSFLNIYATSAYELWGLQYLSAAKASLIYNFSPFVSALFAFLFLHERMNIKKWLGLIIGVLGFLPILISSSGTEQSIIHIGFLSLAEIALLIAAFSTATGWICMKHLIYKDKIAIILANGITMFIGGLITLIHSSFVETWPNLFGSEYTFFWIYMFLGFLVMHIIAYNLYGYLLETFSTTFMTLACMLFPPFTALLGWIFLGETVGWAFFTSLVIVSVGMYIFYRQEK